MAGGGAKKTKKPRPAGSSFSAALQQAGSAAAAAASTTTASFLASAFDSPRCELLPPSPSPSTRTRSPSGTYTCVAWGADPTPGAAAAAADAENGGDADRSDSSLKRRRPGHANGITPSSATAGRLVAAGTGHGEIHVFSAADGKLRYTLSAPASGPATATAVADLCFAPHRPHHIFAATAGGEVVHWDAPAKKILARFKADPHALAKIALAPATAAAAAAKAPHALAVAGNQIRLYDVAELARLEEAGAAAAARFEKSLVKEFTGHATPTVGLKFSASGALCVSAASQDRFVSVWSCDKGSTKTNVTALTLESPPIAVDVAPTDQVLVLSEMGQISLWNAPHAPATVGEATGKRAKTGAVPTRPAESSLSVKVVSADAAAHHVGAAAKLAAATVASPILAAAFAADGKVVIAYGSLLKPTFERVSFLGKDGLLLKDLELTRSVAASGLLINPKTAAGKSLSEGGTAGPKPYAEMPAAPLISGKMSTSNDADGETTAVDASLAGMSIGERLTQMAQADNAASSKKGAAAAAASSDGEAAGARAGANNSNGNGRGNGSARGRNSGSGGGGGGGGGGRVGGEVRRAPPTAASLQTMLSQAIHSSDGPLMDRTLSVRDPATIDATVQRLPRQLVVPFIEQLAARLQSRPARAPVLVRWVRAVVVIHAAYLITNPALVRQLNQLYQTLESRVSTFQRLLKLSGRLELVLSQVSLRSAEAAAAAAGGGTGESGDDEGAEVVYDEEADDGDGGGRGGGGRWGKRANGVRRPDDDDDDEMDDD
ncbi:Dip2/Utp12 family-domain-containing protein [Zopfochytrium polystomum]|nr:Dip2/Utp12 family-domain-containing protein [Zopfochytrium polystomum]